VLLNGKDNEWAAYQVWEPKQGVKDRSEFERFAEEWSMFRVKFR